MNTFSQRALVSYDMERSRDSTKSKGVSTERNTTVSFGASGGFRGDSKGRTNEKNNDREMSHVEKLREKYMKAIAGTDKGNKENAHVPPTTAGTGGSNIDNLFKKYLGATGEQT